ncbi:MAG TPA: putative sulfate exporter family transporter [Candidatus Acidoferrum sp.]|nr:putative sulfate exporter family transporter [Candidatus Acidoferrum sp.]
MLLLAKIIFFLALVLSFTGLLSPPVALAVGILFGLCFTHPYAGPTRTSARILLQVCVVALGFGMNLHEVLKAGRSGFVYTALGISFALLVGLALGKILRVRGNSSFLITAGTAICGGSAIAAVGPILHADDEEMAASLGTVFILNSVALLIFPPIGGALHLSQTQFGLWAALAIHDTSSVVGAAAKYGSQALVVGTTVKLARALWIVPLALATAAIKRRKSQNTREPQVDGEAKSQVESKIQFPWFILFFCLAAILNTYFSSISFFSHVLFAAGRLGLTATLFLIGTGISRATVKEVGWRPLLQGVLLWAAVGLTSLYFIRIGWIAL